MSNEQLFGFACGETDIFINNASILFSGCLKDLSKRYLKYNPFCHKAKHKTHCSFLIANCSLSIVH
ncbi:MAG: hypothetical protein J6U05_05755 [Neisseriaceae bacterium]|nr:hypothetical protein [Neisseriaceae bacterium]